MPGRRRSSEFPRVTVLHFKLLRTFGRNELQRRATDTQRNEFWRMVCESTPNVEYVPHEVVVSAWKKYITANSEDSGLALNGDVDANYVSVGITYKRKMFAAHTTPVRSLIKRLMSLHMRAFDNRVDFLDAMETLCKEVAEPKDQKKAKKQKRAETP